jgi:hypothetical protein
MVRLKPCVLFVFSLFVCASVTAKAPLPDGMDDSKKKRQPAAAEHMESLPQFENYLDMDCHSLVDKDSNDEFIVYFRKKSLEIHSNICSIVGDTSSYEDDDIAQAEKKTIGRGSFSNLLEAHFNEFLHDKKLSIYQNLDCKTMTNRNSSDGFIRFFAAQMAEINVHLCDDLNFDQPMDSDVSQARSPIGRGTYSKLIEASYDDFNYGQ